MGIKSTVMSTGFLHYLGNELNSPVYSAGEFDKAGNARPAFFMCLFDPSSAPSLRAQVQQRVDCRQRDQTGEVKILVID